MMNIYYNYDDVNNIYMHYMHILPGRDLGEVGIGLDKRRIVGFGKPRIWEAFRRLAEQKESRV